jgi:mRNA-degrading endonuclease YafQ of YafQ-DinJ toxin-antitoxin module
MKIFYLKKFIKQYKKLPISIKKQAEEKEEIFRKNPFDPKLKTHKLHGDLKGFLSFSINNNIRIIFDFDKNKNARFYTIGNHDIYY